MYKKISYVLLLLIILGVASFVFINNQKLKTTSTQKTNEIQITEAERIRLIFTKELFSNQQPE